MARDDWYRRTTWTQSDCADFWARIAKSRTTANQAQCIRIQAITLQDADQIDEAISLYRRLLADYPERFELAVTHYQLGKCLLAKGDIDGSLEEFREAIEVQRSFPNVRTKAWLDFGRVAAEAGRRNLYDEFLTYFDERQSERTFAGEMSFPVERYTLAATLAVIHRDLGNTAKAVEFARRALAEASARESGFRYHKNLGLVEDTDTSLHTTVEELAHREA